MKKQKKRKWKRLNTLLKTQKDSEEKRKEKVKLLLEYWNMKGKPFNRHLRDSKYLRAGMIHCCNTLKKYSVHQIMESMDNYYEILTSEKTFAKVGQRGCFISGFSDFFSFTSTTKSRFPKSGSLMKILPEGFKSWFELCLNENAIEYFYTKGWKKFHVLTDEEILIKNLVRKRFIVESQIDEKRLIEKDEQSFIVCTRNLIKFMDKYDKKIYDYFLCRSRPSTYVNVMFDCIVEKQSDFEKLESWHLTANNFFKFDLPSYVKGKNYYE